MNDFKPIFIFSLPRAGSTLLQKILMQHSKITSSAEPWILLPIAYSMKNEGIIAEYSHGVYHRAYLDFIATLPNKEKDYMKEMGNALLNIYAFRCQNNEMYFLDKTPRYHLIIDEIFQLFPNAKFIFLFRNPLDCYASILTTFCGNDFSRISSYLVDLFKGVNNLFGSYKKYKDNSCKVHYEELVTSPEASLRHIFDYLELDWEEGLINDIAQNPFENKLGDPTGYKKFNTISPKSIGIWKITMSNPIRLLVLRKYIKQFAPEVLSAHGVDQESLLKEIRSSSWKSNNFFKDIVGITVCYLRNKFKLNLFFGKPGKWSSKNELS